MLAQGSNMVYMVQVESSESSSSIVLVYLMIWQPTIRKKKCW